MDGNLIMCVAHHRKQALSILCAFPGSIFLSIVSNEKWVWPGFWSPGCLQLGVSLCSFSVPLTARRGWGCRISKPFVFFLPYTFIEHGLQAGCWVRHWGTAWKKQPVWNSSLSIARSFPGSEFKVLISSHFNLIII